MRARNPFVRRWLLYGFLVSFLHLAATTSFGTLTDRYVFVADWLEFPIVWLHKRFDARVLHQLSTGVQSIYGQFEGWSVTVSFLGNSALWGFTLTAVVLYIRQRFTLSHTP